MKFGLSPASFGQYEHWLTAKRLQHEDRVDLFPWSDHYNYLYAHWLENGLYDVVDTVTDSIDIQTDGDQVKTMPLRNPPKRIVEFYAALLWPGQCMDAFKVESDNETIAPALKQLWGWSKWDQYKQEVARMGPCMGDMFFRIATDSTSVDLEEGRAINTRPSEVYFHPIFPPFVTDMDIKRDKLDFFRMDIPARKRDYDNGEITHYIYTEVWSPKGVRIWEHKHGPATPINSLGQPMREAALNQLKFDSVGDAIHWQPWIRSGPGRGHSAFGNLLTKSHELDRMVTRLHDLAYRYKEAIWAALSEMHDAQGRELPAPMMGDDDSNDVQAMIDGITVANLQGVSDLINLAQTNLSDQAAIVEKMEIAIAQDNPELVYWMIHERQLLSGIALYYLLLGARSRLIEARGNALAVLIEVHKAALTYGKKIGLFPGLNVDDLEHEFAPQPVFDMPTLEEAQALDAYAKAGVPFANAAPRAGWTEQEIADAEEQKAREREEEITMAEAMMSSQRRFDRGDQSLPE